MSAKSILTVIGSDIKGVFTWLASPTGQTIIKDAEAVAEDVYPPAAGIIQIANDWLAEILKTQALATAAGAVTGANSAKSAMSINGVRSQVLAYMKAHGYPTPTAEQLQKANDSLVAYMNALEAKS